MNPAWSVIGFTTLAGAAQGLVVALALAQLLGAQMPGAVLRPLLALATALLVAALAASFFHLGRPARAWRAVAMWRTSWLSREVIVLPLFTAAVAAAAWAAGRVPTLGWAALIVGAAVLWWCTAMIYACLRFIEEWAHPYTVAIYTLIGLATGGVLAGAVLHSLEQPEYAQALLPWALAMTGAAWIVRGAAFQRNATLKHRSSAHSAIGPATAVLQQRGPAVPLRQMSMGMTAGAFNLREFFHRARASTLPRLRMGVHGLLFALPLAALAAQMFGAPAWLWWVACVSQVPGVMAERWLFFAQARHPQNLYYQQVG